MTLEECIDKLPKPVRVHTDGEWYTISSGWDEVKRDWIFQNKSHSMKLAIDRVFKKFTNNIRKGDGFKNSDKWI